VRPAADDYATQAIIRNRLTEGTCDRPTMPRQEHSVCAHLVHRRLARLHGTCTAPPLRPSDDARGSL